MVESIGSGGNISFGGLQSGLDTNAIIEAYVKSAERPIRHMERQQAIIRAHKETYTSISSQLHNLHESLRKMSSAAALTEVQATSSAPDIVSVMVEDAIADGTFKLEVIQLASVQRSYSDRIDAVDQGGLFGHGTFRLVQDDNVWVDLQVDETTTLQDVANAINSTESPVVANIINDGFGHRLQVTGTQTGKKSAFVLEESGTTLNFARPTNTPQKAQDAKLILDGFAEITRPSNSINDVVSGLSFDLNQVSDKPVYIKTSMHGASMRPKIDEFIQQYNAMVVLLSEATRYDGKIDRSKSVADSKLTTLLHNLQKNVTRPVEGLRSDICSLSQVGISTSRDGTLSVEHDKLDRAIAKYPVDVIQLFIHNRKNNTQGIAVRIDDLTHKYTKTVHGTLNVSLDSMDKKDKNIQSRIDQVRDNVKKYEITLRDKYNRLEKNMAKLKNQNQYLDALKGESKKH